MQVFAATQQTPFVCANVRPPPSRGGAADRRWSPIVIDQTVHRLRACFETGRTRPLEWRRAQLALIERMLDEREADFAEALRLDLHKSRFESLLSEISLVAGEAKYARRHLARWMRGTRVRTPIMAQPGRSRIVPEPKGVVLIIAPWNYPLSMVLAPLVGALAAGNAVIVKPSEISRHTSAALARILPQYLDTEAVAVVEGGVVETTALLEQRFDHILYTGNERVARIVMAAAAKHLTPVTLELGGKSPCLVAGDADLEVAAARIAWGKFLNAGQTCVAPDHVMVQREAAAPLLEALVRHIREFYGEDAATSPDYGRIVTERHTARFGELLAGQQIHYGGRVDVAQRYVEPTIVLDPAPDSALMREEIFGPVLPVIAVDDMQAAMRAVAARPKPLALYAFTRNAALADAVRDSLAAGTVCINDAVIFMVSPELPFGGVGASGMGRYTGWYGFETFSHMKPVMTRAFRLDAPVRYPPYSETKARLLRLMR
jgi:aldehyde dehydrogenase (NAD+)